MTKKERICYNMLHCIDLKHSDAVTVTYLNSNIGVYFYTLVANCTYKTLQHAYMKQKQEQLYYFLKDAINEF